MIDLFKFVVAVINVDFEADFFYSFILFFFFFLNFLLYLKVERASCFFINGLLSVTVHES